MDIHHTPREKFGQFIPRLVSKRRVCRLYRNVSMQAEEGHWPVRIEFEMLTLNFVDAHTFIYPRKQHSESHRHPEQTKDFLMCASVAACSTRTIEFRCNEQRNSGEKKY